MNIIYTLAVIVITLVLNVTITSSMPYIKQRWNAFITGIKRKLNTPKKQSSLNKDAIEELVTQVIKDKINNGLVTYHKKQMIREIVREEVINYLNELKKK
jgi:predicted secreted Zn-dependent protease